MCFCRALNEFWCLDNAFLIILPQPIGVKALILMWMFCWVIFFFSCSLWFKLFRWWQVEAENIIMKGLTLPRTLCDDEHFLIKLFEQNAGFFCRVEIINSLIMSRRIAWWSSRWWWGIYTYTACTSFIYRNESNNRKRLVNRLGSF